MKHKVVVIPGDGIGPEVTAAVLRVLEAAEAPLEFETRYAGEAALAQGSLVSLLESHRLPDDGVWVVYPQNRHLSPKVRLLVDFLVTQLGK